MQVSNFMKIRQVGAELLHADRRTCRSLIVAIRCFAKPPKEPSVNYV